MQRDCALRITGGGQLTSFSVEYKTGKTEACLSVLNRLQRRPRQTSRRENHHIVRNARVQPTSSSTAIQAQAALSRVANASSRTIRRRLAERHLGSRRPLRVLILTPTHQRLRYEWCRAHGNWTAAEWNQVVFSDESRFNLNSDDNRVPVWIPPGEHLNHAFAPHTAPTAGVIIWGVIAYNTRPLLVLIRGTMTASGMSMTFCNHMCCHSCNGSQEPFFKTVSRPDMLRVSQDCIRTVAILPRPARYPD
ncbi:transposable element Tcb2 transposase [Trichonephila clavipes]|nr:transposable element Tcb2 transposase [Trichonephila clavipes]